MLPLPRGQLDMNRLFLDKWQMYLALTEANLPNLNLPYTQLLQHTSPGMLDRFDAWYIKPCHTWGGNDIARLNRRKSGWALQFSSGLRITPQNALEALEALQNRYPLNTTIVQQEAPVAKWRGRTFDVRVLCQRDQRDQWLVAGTLVRVGGLGSIVSNIGTGHGKVLPTSAVLQQLYQKQPTRRALTKKLNTTSLAICHALDTYYPFEEVGIDYGLDELGGIWLFEVNTNDRLGGPSHDLFSQLPNTRVYEAIEARSRARVLQMIADALNQS